jgi:hypothetical protein
MVGDDLTIAVAMFALCVLEPIDRPTVTMSEQVLRFYISPPKRHRSLPPVASSDSEGDNNDEGIDWVLRISKRKR